MKVSVGDKLGIYRRGYHVRLPDVKEEVVVSDISLSLKDRILPPELEISLMTSTGTVIKTDIRQLRKWLEHACTFRHESDAIYS